MVSSFIKEAEVSNAEYLQGANLPEEERRILSAGDLSGHLGEISFVRNIRQRFRPDIAGMFKPKDMNDGIYPSDYLDELNRWLEMEKYFLGIRLKREPTPADLLVDALRTQTFYRHHLQYLLAHQDRMVLSVEPTDECNHIRMFLHRATDISGFDYLTPFGFASFEPR